MLTAALRVMRHPQGKGHMNSPAGGRRIPEHTTVDAVGIEDHSLKMTYKVLSWT